jgi:hypothetical protein
VNLCAILRRGATAVLEESNAGMLFDTALRAAIMGQRYSNTSTEQHSSALYSIFLEQSKLQRPLNMEEVEGRPDDVLLLCGENPAPPQSLLG